MRFQMRLLWCLACLAILSSANARADGSGRELFQKKKNKELANKEREEDALEAYFIQQATLNKEQGNDTTTHLRRPPSCPNTPTTRTNHRHCVCRYELYDDKGLLCAESMIRFGEEEALKVVKKIDRGDRKKQIAILADLWTNAKGITIVKSLAALLELSPKKTTYFYSVNSEAMDEAEGNGYGFKVSEGLYNALAVTDTNADHHHLLDALLYRKDMKDKKKKGKRVVSDSDGAKLSGGALGDGCTYIKYLFIDAEQWAIEDGRAQHFFRGFDNEEYLSITECFLAPCKGTAAKCCGDNKAVSSGLCSCKVINKKEGAKQCEHNLFTRAPRVIWLCGTPDCQPDEKCLCPAKGSKGKNKGSSRKTSVKTSKTGRRRHTVSLPAESCGMS